MRAVSITFALALLTTSNVPASATTIDFSDLAPGSFTTYVDSDFTVSPTLGSWKVNDNHGAPGPSIFFLGTPGQPITTAQIQITASGSPFTFSSVDLYSSVTPIPYQFTGLLGGSTVFTETGTVPNTSGAFKTVHVTSVGIIDTLLITLSNPAILPGFANPMGLDNIVLNTVPLTWLANISTRGQVGTGDNVMIGGFIVRGATPKAVLLRGRGPSLAVAPFFVPDALPNPVLRLFSGPTFIAQNDNWQDPPSCNPGFTCGAAAQITATGLDPCQPNPGQPTPPANCALESAILITLPPGEYTVHVSGAGGESGVGLVEVFEIPFF